MPTFLRALLLTALAAAPVKAAANPLPGPDRPLKERFAAPPADARIIKIVHSLPDTPEAQDALFASLIAQGFGGIVTNISFHDYLESEERWTSFVRGIEAAKALGMSLWLYDERGYPSGAAGGIVLRDHPEYEARGLLVVDAAADGETVMLDLPEGELFRAVAVPVKDGLASPAEAVEISASIRDRQLVWEPPTGAWHVFVFVEGRLYEGTHAELSLADKLPYINLISPEPTARFLEVTHDAYAQRLGDDLGKHFVSLFTDEPSLMSVFLARQDHRVVPWGPNFATGFQARRGYACEPLLPALFVEAGPEGKRFRYDYWQTVGELVSENFFGQIQNWCDAHNVLSGGHLLAEESFLVGVPFYGNFFQCARRLSAPSIDCLTSVPEGVPWYIARLIGSAAELEGRAVTMSETSDHSQRYRAEGDTRPVRVVTEEEIRGTCNRLILNGINTITSYYSFKDLQPEQMVQLNEWIGRCCTMLRGGHQVADVALLYPVETAWVRFTPSTQRVNEAPADAHRVEHVFHDAETSLFRAQRDFTHVDARTLAEATVEGGELRYRDLRWRIVVLPDADTLPLAAWENLERFYASGGAVVALTSLPANSESEFPAPRVREIAKTVFGEGEGAHINANSSGGVGAFLPRGSEALLPFVLDSILGPEVNVTGADAPVRVTHRRIDDADVFFIINDSRESWEGEISLPAAGDVEQWNPATGQVTMVANGQRAQVHLEPFGGVFYRFAQAVPRQRKQVAPGAIPGLTTAPLPSVEPTVAGGQYVASSAEPEADGWRLAGTLAKSDVDTFLFAIFDYPTPVDLSSAAYLVVDAQVPEQKAAVPLLVVLIDGTGVEYFAEAGIPMNAAGRHTCHVALNRFERAGWCRVTDRPLDLANITSIRVGWGGYYGTEGESVTFTVKTPSVAARP